MAKKKKKKHKSRSFLATQQSVESLRDDCAAALAAGRIRRAYTCLKEMLLRPKLPSDYLPLAGQVVEQRILQLHRGDGARQIADMLASILAKAPALRELIRPEYLMLQHWHENESSFWEKYGSDAAITRQLDSFVLNLLCDPNEIADHPKFSDKHPLKQSAKLIISVWSEIEQGKASRLEELNQKIGRNSPFVVWRLFLNALQAYYSGQNKTALDNLARVRENSPLYKLASELSSLIKNNKQPGNNFQEAIFNGTHKNSLLEEVIQLENSIERKLSFSQCEKLLQNVFSDELLQESPLLYWNLCSVFLTMMSFRAESASQWLELLYSMKDSRRILLLSLDLRKIPALKKWLPFSTQEEFSDLERALVHDRIATLFSLKLHPLNKGYFFFRPPKISKQNALYFFEKMQYHWRKSRHYYPLQETFAKWHQMAEHFLSPAQCDDILEDWLFAFPDDAEVLVKLLESARKRKVYTKAATQLKRLEKAAPNHNALSLAKEFLQIESVLGLIEKKRLKEAARLSAEFTAPSCLFINACQNFTHVLLKKRGAQIEFPLIARHLYATMRRNRFNCQQAITLPPCQEMEALKFFQEFEALLAQSDVVWGDVWLSDLTFPEKGLSGLEQVSSERLWSLCRFFIDQSANYFYGKRILEFFWNLSAQGLSRRDNLTGSFLFLRGHLLVLLCLESNSLSASQRALKARALTALAAACKYLRKTGKLDLLKNLQYYLEQLTTKSSDFDKMEEDLDSNKAKTVVEQEINEKIMSITEKLSFYGYSTRVREEKEFPRFLEEYNLFEELDSDYDFYGDDYDDDDYDDYDDDDYDDDDDDDYDDDDYDYDYDEFPQGSILKQIAETLKAELRRAGINLPEF